MLRSVDLLNEAIRIEPAWPIAYAALADSYNLLANNGVIAHDDGFPKGKNAARKALELDPDLGQAHAAMAFVLWQYDWDRTAADAQFRRAIDLQPSYAAAHHFYALFLVAFGRDAEGFAKIRKALQLDPLAPRINTNYGDMLRVTGREAEGVAQLQKWVAADPIQARTSLILAYAHLNKPSEAMKIANDAAAAKQRSAKVLQALALACVRHKEALPFIHQVEHEFMGTPYGRRIVPAAYLVAGDQESAWNAFRRETEETGPTMFMLREPLYEPLRRDPRYPALLKKLLQPKHEQLLSAGASAADRDLQQ
jgi:hypothetical protein